MEKLGNKGQDQEDGFPSEASTNSCYPAPLPS